MVFDPQEAARYIAGHYPLTWPNFQHWYQQLVLKNRDSYAALGRAKALQLYTTEDGGPYRFRVDNAVFDSLTEPLQRFLVLLSGLNVADYWAAYLNIELVHRGVRLFRPRQRDCEALEHIEPRLPCTDYRQPFSTFVVEFPENYARQRVTPGVTYDGQACQTYPLAVIGHSDVERGVFGSMLLLHNGTALSTCLDMRSDSQTLADNLNTLRPTGASTLSSEDDTLRRLALRVFFNACMLLTHYGCKRLGTTNDAYAARLQERIRKGAKGPAGRAQAQRELAALPAVYGFEQHVTLYDEERQAREPTTTGDSGRIMPAHWRSGHWRSQPCGPQHSERKRVFIKPVLVNPHLLLGPESATSVVIDKKD